MVYKELKTTTLGKVYLKVEYDEGAHAVIMNWIGFCNTEELKAGMEVGLELLQEKNTHRWIADASQMEGGFDEANDWLEKDWTPRAQAAGLAAVAFVLSPDAFNEFSTNEYAERNTDLENPHFKTQEEAKEWIKNK